MNNRKKKLSKQDKSILTEYEFVESSAIQKENSSRSLKIDFKFSENIEEIDYVEEKQTKELFYVDLSTQDNPNKYNFYEEYEQIPEDFKAFIKIVSLKNDKHPVYSFIPQEMLSYPTFLRKFESRTSEILRSIQVQEIIGLQQSYNFHIKEGVKLTETLNQGVITISKVSGTVGKVFTVLGTLGGYASAAASAFSAAKSLLGMFIPELKEPTIADVLKELEEIRAEFKAAIEQLKDEIKQLLDGAFASEYITKSKSFVLATSQLSESFFSTYVNLIKHEGTDKFDQKSLLAHLFHSQNSYFNFLYKQLTDPASTDAIYNAIILIVDKKYINHTIFGKPNEIYDATKVYTENGASWNSGVNTLGALDFSLQDYFYNTPGYDAAYVLKASTKVFCNLSECFIFVSQHLLNYYVNQELDKQIPNYAVLRPQIETALTEITKRLTNIISTWEEYYRQSIQETENYALKLWKNMFFVAASKAKCVSLTYKSGYPGTHKDFVSGIGSRFQQSKFWRTDSYAMPTYEFAIRKDYSDSNNTTGYNSITSHTTLWHLQQGLYNGWGREGWGMSPRGRNNWTYNYLTDLHELRAKIAIMVWSENHKKHIKNLLDYDTTLDSLRKLKANIESAQLTWFGEAKEYYPLKRRENIEIYEFYNDINLNKYSYKQPSIFPKEMQIQKSELITTSSQSSTKKILMGMKYSHRLGLSKQDVIWNNLEISLVDTGFSVINIPKYSTASLQSNQVFPFSEIYLKHNSNIYLVNKVDLSKSQCNLTGIDSISDLLKDNPLFSMNKELINTALASYPSMLKTIHSDLSYKNIYLDFGSWNQSVSCTVVGTQSFKVAVGIRQLFKNDNNIISFGDTAWLMSGDLAYRNHLNSTGSWIYHKFLLRGLPKMNFTEPAASKNTKVKMRVCGFQVVYSYDAYNQAAANRKVNITSAVPHPIYSNGTGIAFECLDSQYDGSAIDILLGRNIWLT